MTFNWDKQLGQRVGLRNQNIALRNENLAQQTGMTLPENRAARAAANYRAPAASIIGGKLVQPGDVEGRNAAIEARDELAADVNARMGLRGSRNVTSMRGMADSAEGGTPTELGVRRAPDAIQATPGAQPPLTGARNVGSRSANRLSSDNYADSLYEDTMQDLRGGFRNGGDVTMKPKMVKQPGYKCGGKVKMPGYEMGGVIGPKVTKWAGEKKKKRKAGKGMRGYADGGKIGNVTEDDGKDTVDVRVREGEYMLAPETVGYMGGGDYEAGVQLLDEMGRQATGGEPGPVPVNEDGEAQRGFRRGGKMGYAYGGVEPYPDPRTVRFGGLEGTGSTLSRGQRFEMAGRQAGEAFRNSRAGRVAGQAAGTARNVVGGMKTPIAVIPAVTGGITAASNLTGARDAFFNDPDVPEWEKAKLAASELSSFALPTAGAVIGAAGGSVVGTPVIGGTAGAVGGGAAGAIADRGLRTALGAPAEGTEYFNEYAANWTPPTEAAAAETAAPEGFRRAFTNELVEDPNVVMRTGGPGDEVIIREDVADGSYVDSEGNPLSVPTFTNLRRDDFEIGSRALQEQADARVAEDMALRERNNAVVQQMRDSAPLYTQEQIDLRNQRNLEQAEAAGRGGSRSSTKPLDLRKELEQQFQRPVYDDDGNITDYMPDPEQIDMFEQILTELQPAIIEQYGASFDQLPLPIRQDIYANYGKVLSDTMAAVSGQRAAGLPTDPTPRTGENALRVIPGSDISFWGDTVFGPATLREYLAGAFDDNPINDRMVSDPLSGDNVRIPLQRLMRRNAGDQMDALRRYGYFTNEE